LAVIREPHVRGSRSFLPQGSIDPDIDRFDSVAPFGDLCEITLKREQIAFF
jgi:hypothetical protein